MTGSWPCSEAATTFLQVFTESTHIVAIRTSGNVYAYEAVQELNIKPKFMKDLLTDQPFTRKDIIHIQDPMNLEASMLVPSPPPPSGPSPLLSSLALGCKGHQGRFLVDREFSFWPRHYSLSGPGRNLAVFDHVIFKRQVSER